MKSIRAFPAGGPHVEVEETDAGRLVIRLRKPPRPSADRVYGQLSMSRRSAKELHAILSVIFERPAEGAPA